MRTKRVIQLFLFFLVFVPALIWLSCTERRLLSEPKPLPVTENTTLDDVSEPDDEVGFPER